MIEYEYSFKAKSLKPYQKYCQENNYKLLRENEEERILYKDGKLLARITTIKQKGKKTILLDFKDDNPDAKLVKKARETKAINLTEDNLEGIFSMLDILGFKKNQVLKRKRIVYEKDNVKFELDKYTFPEKCVVVAIEGDKKKVDNIYPQISNID